MQPITLLAKCAVITFPGFIVGEAVGGQIDEKTTIPLGIAIGIASGVLVIVFPLVWKIARGLQRFLDEQKSMTKLVHNLQLSMNEQQKSFNSLYCVRNPDCMRGQDEQ